MRRCLFGLVLLALITACSSSSASVRSVRADPVVTTSTVPEASPVPEETTTTVAGSDDSPPLSDRSFIATSLVEYEGGVDIAVPHVVQDDEAAVHAITDVPDGWLAVGSITQSPRLGSAALWRVTPEGSFGEPEWLPALLDRAPSIARDVIASSTATFVVGSTDAGRNSVATVWVLSGGAWVAQPLPTEAGLVHGSTAEQVVALSDGTLVVIGRSGGPFFSELITWWSSDGGVTWSSFIPGVSAFLEPLVATDGSVVALLLRDRVGTDGLAGHGAGVLHLDAEGLALDWKRIDPTPGVGYKPRTLIWDGAAFVAGLDTEGYPLLATSTDGLEYSVEALVAPGPGMTEPMGVKGLLVLDGVLTVFLVEAGDLFVFRREGSDLVAVDIPPVLAGDMGYLAERTLLASDGARVAYLGVTWDQRTFLMWNGITWATHRVDELPRHRNSERVEVFSIASAAGSDLALLSDDTAGLPGDFGRAPGGLLWRPRDSDVWQLLDWGTLRAPTAIAAWNGLFVVADVDFGSNRTTWFLFDPATEVFTEWSTMDGRVGSVVASAEGLYAEIEAANSETSAGSTVWTSPDGREWTEFVVPAEPVALCSDGTNVAIVWLEQYGEQVDIRVLGMFGDAASAVGPVLEMDSRLIPSERLRTVTCGVNENGTISTHLGYDPVNAEPTPRTRYVRWDEDPAGAGGLMMPVTSDGAWESWIRQVAWDGTQWIAVGNGEDIEWAQDALLWKSTDGLTWEPAETIAGGPGNQFAMTIVIRDGEMLIGGIDGQKAMIWRLPV